MRSRLLSLVAIAALVAACSGESESTTTEAAQASTTTTIAEEMTTTTVAESTTTEAMEEMNIVATAEAAGEFTTLLAAVEAAGLVETLEGEGPYTAFAPTDDAFAALPEGTVEGLLEDPEALSDILLYHVVPGEVTSDQVVTLESATTAQGSDVSIRVEGDSVLVNDAQVIMTDIQASNGVIHVIDAVLLPPAA
jgi:transforming growth factor-beta-induced protein